MFYKAYADRPETLRETIWIISQPFQDYVSLSTPFDHPKTEENRRRKALAVGWLLGFRDETQKRFDALVTRDGSIDYEGDENGRLRRVLREWQKLQTKAAQPPLRRAK